MVVNRGHQHPVALVGQFLGQRLDLFGVVEPGAFRGAVVIVLPGKAGVVIHQRDLAMPGRQDVTDVARQGRLAGAGKPCEPDDHGSVITLKH